MADEIASAKPNDRKSNEHDEDATLLDVAIVVANNKILISSIFCAVALSAFVYAWTLPNIYTATAKILPPQQTQSTSAVLAQLGSLAGLSGGAVSGLKNPNDLYVGMLKSRTVADSLIQRFDLNSLYGQQHQSETRSKLSKATTMIAGKDGIITIEVDDPEPRRAAAIANGYVDELFKLTRVLAVTEASQRRLFFERQLQQAKDNLASAEASTRLALETGGLVLVEGQGRVMAETNARLRAEITVKEIQIGVMRAFATAQNPELQRTQQQLEVMKRELAKIEGGSQLRGNKDVQGQGIENLRLLREMKYYEATYELLAKQYEIAKIDEAKDSAIIQVMDEAIAPDRKSKPKRALILTVGIIAALLSGLAVAFLLDMLKSIPLRHPQRFARLKGLIRPEPKKNVIEL